jgi:uncharacterized protein DUF6644
MAHSIVVFLKSTAISQMMVHQPWLWPLCETLHFIGLALLIGTAGVFDLRLIGFMRRLPVAAAMRMRPWAGLAVLINLVTGTLFFVGAPDQYIDNPAWWAKVAFLVVAITNIAVFETRYGKQLLAMPPDIDTPVSFKVAGMVSIASWFLVLYFGRMLPFIGTAF